jgi:hypothetical protein
MRHNRAALKCAPQPVRSTRRSGTWALERLSRPKMASCPPTRPMKGSTVPGMATLVPVGPVWRIETGGQFIIRVDSRCFHVYNQCRGRHGGRRESGERHPTPTRDWKSRSSLGPHRRQDGKRCLSPSCVPAFGSHQHLGVFQGQHRRRGTVAIGFHASGTRCVFLPLVAKQVSTPSPTRSEPGPWCSSFPMPGVES